MQLINEPVRVVRHNVAGLISALGKLTVPDGKWNELLTFLLECSRSQKVEYREVAMLLFRALAENIGASLKPHLKTLQAIFVQGLKDSSDRVRVEALKALGVLVDYVGENKDNISSFREVVPPIVEVVKYCVAAGNDDGAAVAFEVFDTFAESPVPILTPHVPLLVKLMIEVAASKKIDINIREKASTFLCAISESQPGKLTKHKLVEEILKCGFQLVTGETLIPLLAILLCLLTTRVRCCVRLLQRSTRTTTRTFRR